MIQLRNSQSAALSIGIDLEYAGLEATDDNLLQGILKHIEAGDYYKSTMQNWHLRDYIRILFEQVIELRQRVQVLEAKK